MSIDIRLKHSSVNGKVPQPTDLSDGELALNTNAADPAIYLKDSAGAVRRVDAGAVPASDWTRTGTVISPTVAGDDVTTTGDVNAANVVATGDVQAASLNSGPLAGFRNQIINGDFRVNQRNGTRTPGVGVYGFDRWKGHAGGLEQIVEALPAGQWTLSWSGGGNGTFGGTTAASPITATVSGGNASVVVPSAATNVQLEPGPVATPFERRPIGTELALCQRYFESSACSYRMFPPIDSGATTKETNVSFKTKKRATPSIKDLTGTGSSNPYTATGVTVDGFRVITTTGGNNGALITGFAADADFTS